MDVQTLVAENKSLKETIARLKFELDNLKRMLFGRTSERYVPTPAQINQLNLFSELIEQSEAEQRALEASLEEAQSVKETITYERNKPQAKPHPGRTPIPDHFPVEEVVIEPQEDTTGLVKIGEQRSEYVEYKPASLIRKVIIRPQYATPDPETVVDTQTQTVESSRILIAELPSRPIPKSIAGASLLAYIMVAKFVDHQPFYRQIQHFLREYDWRVHKSTINSWFAATCCLLEPLYQELVRQTLNTDYIQADESKIQVLTKVAKDKNGKPIKQEGEKPAKQQLGWMWVVHNPLNNYVIFNYEDNRSAKAALQTLKSFTKGYLQTDAYASYNAIAARADVCPLGCLSHVRRKFFDALKSDPNRAQYALDIFKAIYAFERQAKDFDPQQRYDYRLQHTALLYQNLKDWADEQSVVVTPKSPMGQALTYLHNQWPNLKTIFLDGRLLVDNNLIENIIRPLALGRKNYLFAGSHQAAQRIAMMYSFMATCKAKGINPFQWLTHTLEHIADTKITQLHTLLPGYLHQSDHPDL